MDKNDQNDQNQEQDQEQDFLKPLTKSDCPKMTQLEIDAMNILENRVSIKTFPKEYQQKIRNFYRFSPINGNGGGSASLLGGRNFWK